VIGQIVLACCFLIGAVLMASAFSVTAWQIWKLRQFLHSASDRLEDLILPKLSDITQKYHEAVTTIKESQAGVAKQLETANEVTTKYHEGVLAMGQSQVEATAKLEAAIDKFADLMFTNDSGKGFQEYDERKANQEFEVQSLMRNHNVPEDEARERVKEKSVYTNMRVTR
jgi:uncharacterized protein (UPF0332 family)